MPSKNRRAPEEKPGTDRIVFPVIAMLYNKWRISAGLCTQGVLKSS